MIAFNATLFSRQQSIKLGIIAHNTVHAIRIGIGVMPTLEGNGPFGISCTPLHPLRKETTQCAA